MAALSLFCVVAAIALSAVKLYPIGRSSDTHPMQSTMSGATNSSALVIPTVAHVPFVGPNAGVKSAHRVAGATPWLPLTGGVTVTVT